MKVVILCRNLNIIARSIIQSRRNVTVIFEKIFLKDKLKNQYRRLKKEINSFYFRMLLRPDVLFKLAHIIIKYRFGVSERKQKLEFKKYIVRNHNDKLCEDILEKEAPDIIVVLRTRILKPHIFKKAKKGCINIHHGLLPYWRGCDIPFWVLYENGPSGFTIHYINEGLDTGDIIYKEEVNSKPKDTHISLRKRIDNTIANRINKVLFKFEKKAPKGTKQIGKGTAYKNSTIADRFEFEKNRT